jgi:hypothetical protein
MAQITCQAKNLELLSPLDCSMQPIDFPYRTESSDTCFCLPRVSLQGGGCPQLIKGDHRPLSC